MFSLASPAFKTQDLTEALDEGENRRVTLKFTALPIPEVEWRLNDSLVKGVQIDSSHSSTTLHIENADRAKHAGKYSVTLRNSVGIVTTTVTVKVTGEK